MRFIAIAMMAFMLFASAINAEKPNKETDKKTVSILQGQLDLIEDLWGVAGRQEEFNKKIKKLIIELTEVVQILTAKVSALEHERNKKRPSGF